VASLILVANIARLLLPESEMRQDAVKQKLSHHNSDLEVSRSFYDICMNNLVLIKVSLNLWSE